MNAVHSSGVMLVGEALVDEFAEQPVAGGAPLNVARSLAALGVPATLVSRLGLSQHVRQHQGPGTGASAADAGARLVLASLRRFGLDEQGLQFDTAHATGRVSVVEEGGTHAFRIHPDAAWDHLDGTAARALLQKRPPAVLYFGSLAQRAPASRAAIQALLQDARRLGCLRYLDLNLREGCTEPSLVADCLAQADWLKLNDPELRQVHQWFGSGPLDPLQPARQLQPAVQALMRRFGVRRLILTRGAAGHACFDARGEVLAEGPGRQDLTLVDTVGAGDAFSAMTLAAHLRGLDIAPALHLANGYAAAICGQRGPIPDKDPFFQPWQQALAQTGVATA